MDTDKIQNISPSHEEPFLDRQSAIALITFLLIATAYHIEPNMIIGILVVVAGFYSLNKSIIVLPFIITFGYLTHTMLNDGSSRIFFSIPAAAGILWCVVKRRPTSQYNNLTVSTSAIIICSLLFILMLTSEIVDPQADTQGNVVVQRLLYIILAMAIARTVSSFSDYRAALLSLTTSSVYLSIDMIWKIHVNGLTSLRQAHIVEGLFSDSNYLAFYLCVGLGPCLVFSVFPTVYNKLLTRILSSVSAIIIVWAVLLTSSRMGLIALCILILFILFRLLRSHSIRIVYSVAMIIFLSCGAFYAFLLIADQPIITDLLGRWRDPNLYTGGGRVDVTLQAIYAFYSSSIAQQIFGGGAQANYVLIGGINTHNAFLEYLLDYGIIGMMLISALIIISACHLRRGTNEADAIAGWCVWITLLVCSFGISPFAYAWGWAALAPLIVSPIAGLRKSYLPISAIARRSAG